MPRLTGFAAGWAARWLDIRANAAPTVINSAIFDLITIPLLTKD
jgi:hypothetical protein